MLIYPPICRQTRLSSRQNSGGWCVWFLELILVVTLRLRITGTVATTHIEIEICGVISLNCTTKQYCYFQQIMCITPTIHFVTNIVNKMPYFGNLVSLFLTFCILLFELTSWWYMEDKIGKYLF